MISIASFCSLVLFSAGQVPSRSVPGPKAATSFNDKNICGPIALVCAAEYLGRPDLFQPVFENLPPSGEVRTLEELKSVAERLGSKTSALHWRRGSLPTLSCPAIIHVNPAIASGPGHFILLLSSSGNRVLILDFPGEPQWIKADELWRIWDGTALHLAKSESQLPHSSPSFVRLAASVLAVSLGLVLIFGFGSRTSHIRSRRRLAWISTAFITAFAIAVSLSIQGIMDVSGTPRYDRPTIEAIPESQDFHISSLEAKDPHKIIPLVYRITNHGSDTASIRHVVTSCGCATARFSSRRIAPGESIQVNVEVKPGSNANRPFRIWVEFDKPEVFVLTLRGSIILGQDGTSTTN